MVSKPTRKDSSFDLLEEKLITNSRRLDDLENRIKENDNSFKTLLEKIDSKLEKISDEMRTNNNTQIQNINNITQKFMNELNMLESRISNKVEEREAKFNQKIEEKFKHVEDNTVSRKEVAVALSLVGIVTGLVMKLFEKVSLP